MAEGEGDTPSGRSAFGIGKSLGRRLRREARFQPTNSAITRLQHFSPMDEGFQRIDAGLHSFAVSVEDVVPYGDGVNVRLDLGNPSTASYSGLKLLLRYCGTVEDHSNLRNTR